MQDEVGDRPDAPLDGPEVEVGVRKIPRVFNVAYECLPGIAFVGLPAAREFGIELFNRESAGPADGDMASIAVGAHAPEPRRMMGLGELKAASITCHDQVVGVGVLVDDNPGMVTGHDDLPEDSQRGVITGGGDEPFGPMGRPGGLHIIDTGVDEDILQLGLHRETQVDAVDARVVVGAYVQVKQDDEHGGEATVQ